MRTTHRRWQCAQCRDTDFSGSVVILAWVFGSLCTLREGACRGACNSGNLRVRTAARESSHPLDAAQWRSVTANGSEGRETYKQEVPGSSPGPPIISFALQRPLRAFRRVVPSPAAPGAQVGGASNAKSQPGADTEAGDRRKRVMTTQRLEKTCVGRPPDGERAGARSPHEAAGTG
jgi:hypothetical protein